MKHDYERLREMAELGYHDKGTVPIKDKRGRVLKRPNIKWRNPTYTRSGCMGTAQPSSVHTDPLSHICQVHGFSVAPHVVEKVKRGSR